MKALKIILLAACTLLFESINAQGSLIIDRRCPANKDIGICANVLRPTCTSCGCREMCCPVGCGRTCLPIPLPQELDCLKSTTCSSDVCDGQTCPGVPNAQCTPDCNCRPVFLDCDGRIVDRNECNVPSTGGCLPGVPTALCTLPPSCDVATCPGVPGATCRNNFCGGCSAIFTAPNGDVLTDDECKVCTRPRFCYVSPCRTARCPNFPRATCRSARCDTCVPVFTFLGFVLTEKQCGSLGFPHCVPLNTNLPHTCNDGNNIGSVCTINCPPGQVVKGPASSQCRENGHWVPSLGTTECVPDPRCPRPSGDFGICPVCNPDECSPGQICCPTGCGSTCSYPIGFPHCVPLNTNLPHTCNDGNNIGSVCTINCPPGQVVKGPASSKCRENGHWVPSLGTTQCVPDPRCPPRRGFVGRCPMCNPDHCQLGQICCPAGCGSICTEPLECPPPVDPRAFVNFRVRCTHGSYVGSKCTATCRKGLQLVGVSQIVCGRNEMWNPSDLTNSICVKIDQCPPGSPQVRCAYPPCRGARCPAYPDAVCRDNYCGGCDFDFYRLQNGKPRKLSRRDCIEKLCSNENCKLACRNTKCPAYPDAICEPTCFCVPKFYDPVTLRRVKCH
ncbi:P-selectin-like [Clavelina lepadiformis]|uniref:P-selectin-like n=1 Tax=Clavelina lepadiformis TaxID=159417 RepID=UPI0040428FA1